MSKQARQMTADEIALMREIVRWRRNHDVQQWKASRNLGRFVQWTGPGRNGKQVSVDFYRGDEGLRAAMSVSHRQTSDDLEIDDRWTFVQAVDVLVALGYLPQQFSSAYRQAWHAAQQWYDDQARDEDEFRRLFHDPENISFPAVEK